MQYLTILGTLYNIVPNMTEQQITQIVDKTEVNVRKGILMYAVLHVLKHGSVYSSDILVRLSMANMIVVEGTVYPLLTRLLQEGIVCYEWRESDAGPPRKYYQLTEDGHAVVTALQPKVAALINTVRALESDGKGMNT